MSKNAFKIYVQIDSKHMKKFPATSHQRNVNQNHSDTLFIHTWIVRKETMVLERTWRHESSGILLKGM